MSASVTRARPAMRSSSAKMCFRPTIVGSGGKFCVAARGEASAGGGRLRRAQGRQVGFIERLMLEQLMSAAVEYVALGP